MSQQNAYAQAQDYLGFTPFSRAGLIDQLSSEFGGQFPPGDAEFAVARLEAEGGVDWNAEAVEAAQSYQELTPMSRQGLIDQLTSLDLSPACGVRSGPGSVVGFGADSGIGV